MIQHYLKYSLRGMWLNRRFSIINIAGFAFSISLCLAIFLFVSKEFSFDKDYKNADRIFALINSEGRPSHNLDIRDQLLNYPEVKSVAAFHSVSGHVTYTSKSYYLNGSLSVNNDFFDVFSVSFNLGNRVNPFPTPESVIITQSFSDKLFGNENPIGKEIVIRNRNKLTVSAVIEDFAENSSISAEMLLSNKHKEFNWEGHHNIYIEFLENVNSSSFIGKFNSQANQTDQIPYALAPLESIHLAANTQFTILRKGNYDLLQLLVYIGLIILTMSIVNYVNMTIALQTKKMKDAGIMKTIGASGLNIRNQILTESLLVIALSSLMALAFLYFLTPIYQQIFDSEIYMADLFNYQRLLILVIAMMVIGLISGIGPAIAFSRLSPMKTIFGLTSPDKKNNISGKILTIFQISTSITLICCVICINRQIHFVKHQETGFDREELVYFKIPGIQPSHIFKAQELKAEFSKCPWIKSTSVSMGIPGKGAKIIGYNLDNSNQFEYLTSFNIDESFLETFGIALVEGRQALPGERGSVALLSESAFKKLGFADLEGASINTQYNGVLNIIGIVKDFQSGTLHKENGPMILFYPEYTMPSGITVRFHRNAVHQGMKYIAKVWDELPAAIPFEYEFYDDIYNNMYKQEERLAETISFFGILAVAISCLGVLGVSMINSDRRTKEIGIRKVNGAKISEILTLLNKDFVKWVLIAFVIATPIAWYAMTKWLENFAYKTELSWWVFALAGLMALGVALLTVSWQSWKAATRNPVEALRYE